MDPVHSGGKMKKKGNKYDAPFMNASKETMKKISNQCTPKSIKKKSGQK